VALWIIVHESALCCRRKIIAVYWPFKCSECSLHIPCLFCIKITLHFANKPRLRASIISCKTAIILLYSIKRLIFVMEAWCFLWVRKCGLRPLRCWNWWFDSRLGHGCLSFVIAVCCQVYEGVCDEPITRPEDSYRLLYHCVWYRGHRNEAALAGDGLLRQRRRKDKKIHSFSF
jgi:hypothetical protein